jgi:hypothetical protein
MDRKLCSEYKLFIFVLYARFLEFDTTGHWSFVGSLNLSPKASKF